MGSTAHLLHCLLVPGGHMLQPYASCALGQETRWWQGPVSYISYFAKYEGSHARVFHVKLVDNT